MPVIDEDGRLFGRLNIIDALVVLFVAAVLLAGVALITGSGNSAEESPTRTIVFETGEQPEYVITAISEGSVPTSAIVAIENKSVLTPTADTSRLRLTVTVTVGETSDGLPTFADERLYVGRTLQLDFGTTIVQGTVVDMRS